MSLEIAGIVGMIELCVVYMCRVCCFAAREEGTQILCFTRAMFLKVVWRNKWEGLILFLWVITDEGNIKSFMLYSSNVRVYV